METVSPEHLAEAFSEDMPRLDPLLSRARHRMERRERSSVSLSLSLVGLGPALLFPHAMFESFENVYMRAGDEADRHGYGTQRGVFA